MEPTRRSVLKAMAEYREIGNDEFLRKYTKGRPPIYMYLRHQGTIYPLKALWAASHRPAVAASSFNSVQAKNGLRHLDFTDAVNLENEDAEIIVLDEIHHRRSERPAVMASDLFANALDIRNTSVREGKRIVRELSFIKRNATVVANAKMLNGYVCEACDFDFAEVYGTIGEGFIEAHHLNPLAERNGIDKKTTVNDFAMLCSNCHKMVHRHEPVLSVRQLRAMLKKMRQGSSKRFQRQRSAH